MDGRIAVLRPTIRQKRTSLRVHVVQARIDRTIHDWTWTNGTAKHQVVRLIKQLGVARPFILHGISLVVLPIGAGSRPAR
jgi:hypothetical protein